LKNPTPARNHPRELVGVSPTRDSNHASAEGGTPAGAAAREVMKKDDGAKQPQGRDGTELGELGLKWAGDGGEGLKGVVQAREQ